MRLLLDMRDTNFRPIIRTLADALDKIDQAGLKPVGSLRGGAIKFDYNSRCLGVMSWIEGKTESERFRVAMPISEWLSGKDQNNRRHERPMASFNGATILRDGSLRLEENLWIDRVEFSSPTVPLTFELTDTQKSIAKLVSKYLNLLGHDCPIEYVHYPSLAQVELPSLRPVSDFVRSHWHEHGRNTAAPSRETIASTLEALFIRRRVRNQS